MVYHIDKEFLRVLLNEQAKSMVGEICKQNELLVDQKIPERQKLEILKAFNKEKVYESFRNIEKHINSHSKGQKSVKLYRPTKS